MAEEYMSAGEKPPEAQHEDGQENQEFDLFNQAPGTDWFLAYLIGFAEDLDFESGITLWVGGKIITGTLIGGRKYFGGLEDTILSSGGNLSDESKKWLAKSYGQFKDIYREPNADTPLHSTKPGYIHLKNARSYENGLFVPQIGVLWRGKLSAVEGYMIGEMVPG